MKATALSIIIAVILIGGSLAFARNGGAAGQAANANNVSVIGGKQIVEIHAKGGYQPRRSIARSGVPTVLRFETSGTFDCSSTVRIPSMNISKSLPQSGTTDIDIGSPQLTTLQGTCGMGMYPFEVDFQS